MQRCFAPDLHGGIRHGEAGAGMARRLRDRGARETTPLEGCPLGRGPRDRPSVDPGSPPRPASQKTRLRFRYSLRGSGEILVALGRSGTGERARAILENPAVGEWSEAVLDFEIPATPDGRPAEADEIRFHPGRGATLLIDDLLLFEPGG